MSPFTLTSSLRGHNPYRNWNVHASNRNPEEANTEALAKDLYMTDELREVVVVRMTSYQ